MDDSGCRQALKRLIPGSIGERTWLWCVKQGLPRDPGALHLWGWGWGPRLLLMGGGSRLIPYRCGIVSSLITEEVRAWGYRGDASSSPQSREGAAISLDEKSLSLCSPLKQARDQIWNHYCSNTVVFSIQPSPVQPLPGPQMETETPVIQDGASRQTTEVRQLALEMLLCHIVPMATHCP